MMLRRWHMVALVLVLVSLGTTGLFATGQREVAPVPATPEGGMAAVAPGLVRNETLIMAIQGGRNANPDRFNPWVAPSFLTAGLQQGALDTLWYVGQLDGTWDNGLAAARPVYNDDFTEMTVKLREGIYWSDGVPFTAEDVVATVEVQMENPGMAYTDFFNTYVESVSKPDDYTVVFRLKRANSRFHVQFTVRWSACYIMPAHIFRNVDNPITYDFNPPVSLSQYVLKDYDPNGYWFIWEKRADWDRTWVGQVYGEPAAKNLLYIHYGDLSAQTIAQTRHELDISQLWTPDAWESLSAQNPYARAWYEDFPYATFGDPAAPSVTLNNDVDQLGNVDVRWALTLTVDAVSTLTAAYSGAARVTPIANTPTAPYYEWYYEPLEPWLKEFELDIRVDGRPFRPYDPDIPIRMVEEAGRRGYTVPTDEREIREIFGIGWWKYAPEVAEELLLRNGFTRDSAGRWVKPNGERFRITIMTQAPDAFPLQARLGGALASKWREFGIDAQHQVNELTWAIQNRGDYQAAITWPVETWGGHPDMHRFLQFWHSDYYKPIGETANGRNPSRWTSDEMDRLVEEMERYSADSEETIRIGQEAMKLMVREMPLIPLVGQNQLNPADTYYWTNWPSAENPYAYPLPSGGNYKRVFPFLEPTGR